MDAQTLMDRTAVHDRIIELFTATDEKAWGRVKDCFAPSVDFDMTSLAGGDPVTLTPGDIAGAWEEGLAAVDVVHHHAGNFRISVADDRADAACYGIAYHHTRGETGVTITTFVGSYDFALNRDGDTWRIAAFRFNARFVDTREGEA